MGAIRSASRLRFRFGQVKMNDHNLFGVRRLVAAMAWASERKRRQVAALHIALVICPSFARIPRRPDSHLHPRIDEELLREFSWCPAASVIDWEPQTFEEVFHAPETLGGSRYLR